MRQAYSLSFLLQNKRLHKESNIYAIVFLVKFPTTNLTGDTVINACGSTDFAYSNTRFTSYEETTVSKIVFSV